MGIAGWPFSSPCVVESEVRAQLDKILASDIFGRSERLSRFLRFVVEETVAGRGGELKENTLGSQLYRKGGEFDGSADPIVRVDARRLRDKLREYYFQFSFDPVLISLPKGTYVPVFQKNSAAVPAHAQPQRRRFIWGALTSAVAALVVVLLTLLTVLRPSPQVPARLIRITAFPGLIGAPSLSSDGKFVAFSWKGPDGKGKPDIWVKAVEGDSLRRLTNTPDAKETEAAWSPDGRNIAFVREGEGVFLVPSSGGAERKLSSSGTHVGWTPDSRSLLIRDRDREDVPYGIYQLSLAARERRRLTQAPSGIGDWRFSVSPDGRNLALVRYERPGVGDLFIVSFVGGEARRLTNWNGILTGAAWSPDGRDIIYGAAGLWRIPASSQQPGRGTPVTGAPDSAMNPSLVRPPGQRARLVFQTSVVEASMRIIDLVAPLQNGVFQAKPFAAPSRLDYPGTFSPDSRKLTFGSARDEKLPKLTGGMPELWISALDGTGLRKLHTAPHLSNAGWSHDGRRIVYDCAAGGNSDIYVLNIADGTSTRLTFEPSIDAAASWSGDDRWIYYTSTRDASWGKPDIWRISSAGGQALRITFHGGIRPIESMDGRYLYYCDRPQPNVDDIGKSRLMRVPVGGGPEVGLIEGFTPFWWSVTEAGIYFLARERDFDAVNRYDPARQKVTRIGRLPFRVPFSVRFAVSPNARWALTGTEHTEQDLMLLDGFR